MFGTVERRKVHCTVTAVGQDQGAAVLNLWRGKTKWAAVQNLQMAGDRPAGRWSGGGGGIVEG